MTRGQFAFGVGFAAALVWATVGFLIMLGVLAAGAFGWVIVGFIDGQWNVEGVRSWLARSRKSPSSY
jgi:hypothetical protein